MIISVFGLGYVGCVGIGCMAKQGHTCIGVDVNATKVEQINSGKPTIIEDEIEELLLSGYKKGKIRATNDSNEAVASSDISFICVGTPNGPNGHLDLKYVYRVAEQIGLALRKKINFHTVVIRSTVFPGTNARVTQIIQDNSEKTPGKDFSVVSNPEFLREGSAVSDYFNPSITVIGTDSDRAREGMLELYSPLPGLKKTVSIETAEIIKYVNNSFHALKIAFSNEVGNICKKLGLDSHDVMSLFCEDKKLNISEKYLMPGSAYGGSCLPKDLKGLKAISHDSYLETPIIDGIERSNSYHKDVIIDLVMEQAKRRVGVLGLSFKAGTDDLRNSPSVELVERLLGKGYDIRIYDKNVHLSNLMGTNKEEIERRIPHISNFITDDLNAVISHGDVIIISYAADEFLNMMHKNEDKIFIDLARIDSTRRTGGNYIGISW